MTNLEEHYSYFFQLKDKLLWMEKTVAYFGRWGREMEAISVSSQVYVEDPEVLP